MVDEYLQTQVLTASPHRLHLIVIDGALRHARRAEEALNAGDFETAHFALNKSREFVAELLSGLDENAAPELVPRLKSLFLFVYRNLAEADRLRDAALIQAACRILEIHRQTWLDVGRLQAAPGDVDAAATGRSWVT